MTNIYDKVISNYSYVGKASGLLDDLEAFFTAYYDELTEDHDE